MKRSLMKEEAFSIIFVTIIVVDCMLRFEKVIPSADNNENGDDDKYIEYQFCVI